MSKENLKIQEAKKFFLYGILIFLLTALIHEYHNFWITILVSILSHIGVGLIVVSILTIILDMEHWTKYFEERLSDLVINKTYLKKIDQRELINLQTDVLKVYFKNDTLGNEEGFLSHYQKNIQELIGTPYRKDVTLNLYFENDTNETYRVIESMTYTCMENGSKIQEFVSFAPEEGEIDELIDINLTLNSDSGINSYDFESLKSSGYFNIETKSLKYPLTTSNNNKLKINYKVVSKIKKNRFIAWRMSHPTKNLNININFPKGYLINKELFINENLKFLQETNENDGYFNLSISDWLLPDEGLVFQIQSK